VDEDTTSPGPAPGSPSGPALDIRHPGAGPCEDTGTPSISTVIVCTRGPRRRQAPHAVPPAGEALLCPECYDQAPAGPLAAPARHEED